MEDKKESYFGEIGGALKTLATGLKTTMKEYFTPKSTEQYPENRKTTLHVSKRHRGRLVFVRDENGNHKCVACTMCEKACPNGTITITHEMVENPETGKKKRQLIDYQYDLGECMFCQLCVNACNSAPSSLPTTSKTPSSTARSSCSTSTRRTTRAAVCPTSSTAAPTGKWARLTPKPNSVRLWQEL